MRLDAAILQNGHWVLRRSANLGAMKGSLQFPQQPGHLWGIAVSAIDGSVFVSDHKAMSQIHVFDVQGKYVRTFGQIGEEEGKLYDSLGIDVSANGQVYVANQFNHCVSVFQKDGTFIQTIGKGKLMYPSDVFVHSSGLVCVADSSHCRIAVFSQNGELVHTFGSRDEGRGKFGWVSGICGSPDGRHLYISDQTKCRVLIFSLEGQYVGEFGSSQLKNPHGLLVTSNGSVLVADGSNNCVTVFNKKGEFAHSIAVVDPRSLAIDNRGDLYVVSGQEKCVLYF